MLRNYAFKDYLVFSSLLLFLLIILSFSALADSPSINSSSSLPLSSVPRPSPNSSLHTFSRLDKTASSLFNKSSLTYFQLADFYSIYSSISFSEQSFSKINQSCFSSFAQRRLASFNQTLITAFSQLNTDALLLLDQASAQVTLLQQNLALYQQRFQHSLTRSFLVQDTIQSVYANSYSALDHSRILKANCYGNCSFIDELIKVIEGVISATNSFEENEDIFLYLHLLEDYSQDFEQLLSSKETTIKCHDLSFPCFQPGFFLSYSSFLSQKISSLSYFLSANTQPTLEDSFDRSFSLLDQLSSQLPDLKANLSSPASSFLVLNSSFSQVDAFYSSLNALFVTDFPAGFSISPHSFSSFHQDILDSSEQLYSSLAQLNQTIHSSHPTSSLFQPTDPSYRSYHYLLRSYQLFGPFRFQQKKPFSLLSSKKEDLLLETSSLLSRLSDSHSSLHSLLISWDQFQVQSHFVSTQEIFSSLEENYLLFQDLYSFAYSSFQKEPLFSYFPSFIFEKSSCPLPPSTPFLPQLQSSSPASFYQDSVAFYFEEQFFLSSSDEFFPFDSPDFPEFSFRDVLQASVQRMDALISHASDDNPDTDRLQQSFLITSSQLDLVDLSSSHFINSGRSHFLNQRFSYLQSSLKSLKNSLSTADSEPFPPSFLLRLHLFSQELHLLLDAASPSLPLLSSSDLIGRLSDLEASLVNSSLGLTAPPDHSSLINSFYQLRLFVYQKYLQEEFLHQELSSDLVYRFLSFCRVFSLSESQRHTQQIYLLNQALNSSFQLAQTSLRPSYSVSALPFPESLGLANQLLSFLSSSSFLFDSSFNLILNQSFALAQKRASLAYSSLYSVFEQGENSAPPLISDIQTSSLPEIPSLLTANSLLWFNLSLTTPHFFDQHNLSPNFPPSLLSSQLNQARSRLQSGSPTNFVQALPQLGVSLELFSLLSLDQRAFDHYLESCFNSSVLTLLQDQAALFSFLSLDQLDQRVAQKLRHSLFSVNEHFSQLQTCLLFSNISTSPLSPALSSESLSSAQFSDSQFSEQFYNLMDSFSSVFLLTYLDQSQPEFQEKFQSGILDFSASLADFSSLLLSISSLETFSLPPGRHPIIFSHLPANFSVSQLKTHLPPSTYVQYYDASSNSWLIYNPRVEYGNTLHFLQPGQLYWIKSNTSFSLPFSFD